MRFVVTGLANLGIYTAASRGTSLPTPRVLADGASPMDSKGRLQVGMGAEPVGLEKEFSTGMTDTHTGALPMGGAKR